MPEPTTDWETLYKQASDAMHKAYHDLLEVATHLDDRRPVQRQVWWIANELMRRK